MSNQSKNERDDAKGQALSIDSVRSESTVPLCRTLKGRAWRPLTGASRTDGNGIVGGNWGTFDVQYHHSGLRKSRSELGDWNPGFARTSLRFGLSKLVRNPSALDFAR